jgi:AraC-like DNA-binding protein
MATSTPYAVQLVNQQTGDVALHLSTFEQVGDFSSHYNFLVEQNFRRQHQVKFYAGQLNRSPKTLSNLFALYNHKSPLMIIQERIIQEAKRLLIYTDKTAKEIAYYLGFEDAGHFGKFFKKRTGQTPSEFKSIASDTPATAPALSAIA